MTGEGVPAAATLLAVDFRAEDIEVLRRVLADRMPDWDLRTAVGRDECIRLAIELPISVAILGLGGSEQSRIELCRNMKAEPRTSKIPILLITGPAGDARLNAMALDATVDELVTLPLEPLELSARLRALHRMRHAEDRLRAINAGLERLVEERTGEAIERERSLVTTLNSMIEAVFTTDADGRVTKLNRRAAEISGWDTVAAIGRAAGEVMRLESASGEALTEVLVARILGGSGAAVEVPEGACLLGADGNRVPVEGSGTVLDMAFKGNERPGAMFVLRDITERLRAQRAVQHSEGIFQSLSDSAPIGIYLADLDGNMTYANQRWLELAGRESVPETPDAWKNSVLPEDREHVESLCRCLTETRSCEGEFRLTTAQGAVRWVDCRSAAIRTSTGEITGIVSAWLDVTRQKLIEEHQRLTTGILGALIRPGDMRERIGEALELIREAAGIEAAGIRLRLGQDFPYYGVRGIPAEHLLVEYSLCGADIPSGSDATLPVPVRLQCICGAVIEGRREGFYPAFTEAGSFWTNSLTETAVSLGDHCDQFAERGTCIRIGIESAAFIPLRSEEATIGLLQLMDHRKGMVIV